MAYEVLRTAAFERDYDKILGYLTDELQNRRAALNFMGEIARAASVLSAVPFIHAVSSKPNLALRNIRVHALSRYVVLYVVHDSRVYLVRLFHQSQLYDADRYWLTSCDEES